MTEEEPEFQRLPAHHVNVGDTVCSRSGIWFAVDHIECTGDFATGRDSRFIFHSADRKHKRRIRNTSDIDIKRTSWMDSTPPTPGP